MPTALLTSSVSTASISTAVLVATTRPITVVISLEVTTATATEAALPVVETFIRWRACLAALLIVLL